MSDMLTVSEYATATTKLRELKSKLLADEMAATKAALARLKEIDGQIERKRRGNFNASRLIKTARMAELIALRAQLERESLEAETLGRQRLKEATAERCGIRPDQVSFPGRRGRPKVTTHGLPMYRRGCRCDKCRTAKAASRQAKA